MKRIAAIDVGSNGIRLALADASPSGRLHALQSIRAPIRLGRDVFRTGKIQLKTARKTRKTFLQFLKIMKKYRVKHVKAVATSAVREAKNRAQFVNWLQEQTGLHLCVIDGNTEALLIHKAVASAVELKNRRAAHIDIGGGSLEITVTENGAVAGTRSFPMGTVRTLLDSGAANGGQPLQSISKSLKKHLPALKSFCSEMQSKEIELFIGTGGNIECLGNLRVNLLGKTTKNFLAVEELERLIKIISSLSYKERISKLGLREDRADVILPAAMALLASFRLLNIREILIPFVGLKNGVLIDLAESKTDNSWLCSCNYLP